MGRKVTQPPEPDKEKTMGQRLAAVRERLGLSKAQAAEQIGATVSYWADLEADRKTASLDKLWEIAGKLGVDPNLLDPRLSSGLPNANPDQAKDLRAALEAAQKALDAFIKLPSDPKGGN